MYNTDRPIDNVKNDLLGRASFSKQLSKALYYYSGDDSLVVGLFGKWGSGKTSVINMALQTMDEMNYDNEEKPIIVKFAPWNYSSQDNCRNDNICRNQSGQGWSNQARRKGKNAWTQVV